MFLVVEWARWRFMFTFDFRLKISILEDCSVLVHSNDATEMHREFGDDRIAQAISTRTHSKFEAH